VLAKYGTGLWANGDFLKLWAAQGVSAVGSRITRTAIPVIAVLSVQGTAMEISVLSALSIGPGALVGLLLGGTIDRSRKRPLLIASDIIRALLVLSIPAAAYAGALTMLQLYGVAALIGCASVLFEITDNTYLPVLVGHDDLAEANSKVETTDSLAEISGPGIAGILIEVLSAPITMVIDALSYLVSAALLVSIRKDETPSAHDHDSSLGEDFKSGLRACWSHSVVRPLLIATSISTTATSFFLALYILFTLDNLGLSPGVLGVVISVGGVGALIGAVFSRRISRRWGPGTTMIVCLAGAQLAALLLPLATDSGWPSLSLLVAHQLLSDGLFMAFTIQALTLRQQSLPPELLGRGNAVFSTATSVLLPAGALLAGGLATSLGVRTALWIGLGSGLAAPFFLWPLRNLKN
jgi:predicted MFS family arabinose efflux permease